MEICKNFTYNEKDATTVAEFEKTKKKYERLLNGHFVCTTCNHPKCLHELNDILNSYKLSNESMRIIIGSYEQMERLDNLLKKEINERL